MSVRPALFVALLLIPTVVRTQDVSFSSQTRAVRVDVLVSDKGQPLLGLGPSDFEVRDNGVPQQVDLVNFDDVPLNVTLALDMSDSVAGERLGRLRAAAGGLLAGVEAQRSGGSHHAQSHRQAWGRPDDGSRVRSASPWTRSRQSGRRPSSTGFTPGSWSANQTSAGRC